MPRTMEQRRIYVVSWVQQQQRRHQVYNVRFVSQKMVDDYKDKQPAAAASRVMDVVRGKLVLDCR